MKIIEKPLFFLGFLRFFDILKSVFYGLLQQNLKKSTPSSDFGVFFYEKTKIGVKRKPKMSSKMIPKPPKGDPKGPRRGAAGSEVRSTLRAEASGKGREGVKPLPRDWGLGFTRM